MTSGFCAKLDLSREMNFWLQLQAKQTKTETRDLHACMKMKMDRRVWQNLARIPFETFQEEEYLEYKYFELNMKQKSFKWNRNHSVPE